MKSLIASLLVFVLSPFAFGASASAFVLPEFFSTNNVTELRYREWGALKGPVGTVTIEFPIRRVEFSLYNSRNLEKDGIPALHGERRFDVRRMGHDDNGNVRIIEDEDWLEHLEEIKSQYDEDEEEQEEKPVKKTTKKPAKPAEEEEEEEDEKPAKKAPKREEDEFDDMDRTDLKAYINENELEISVKKSMSDDDLRDAIRQELASQEETSEKDNEPEPEEEEEEKPRSKMSLADIKKKLGKK